LSRRERHHRRAQQLTRAASENDVLRLHALHLRDLREEIVRLFHGIAIGVAEMRRDRREGALAGPVRILVAVQPNHAGHRREQTLGVRLRGRELGLLLLREQGFVSAPRKNRGAKYAGRAGAEGSDE